MPYLKKSLVILGALCLLFAWQPKQALAVKFDLIAPTGTLSRGGNATFTVTVDTQGSSLTETQVGMTYDNTVLKYTSITPDNTFSNVSATQQSDGTLLLNGTNGTAFSGSGNFADVTFSIIAQSAGSTQLCTLFAPSPTTIAPTTVGTTTTPAPTALPKTGSTDEADKTTTLGFLFIGATVLLFLVSKILFKQPVHHPHHKTK